jgi:hypothetical protein
MAGGVSWQVWFSAAGAFGAGNKKPGVPWRRRVRKTMVGFTSHAGGGPEPNGKDGKSDVVTLHVQGDGVVDEHGRNGKREITMSMNPLVITP